MRIKISLYILLSLLFLGCGGSSENSSSQTSNYTITYDDTHTKISGTVQFNLKNISNGHTITVENFIPSINGCNIDFTDTSFTPQTLTFSKNNNIHTLNLDIGLLAPCEKTTLTLKATYTEKSTLDGKPLEYSKEESYTFSILKSQTAKQSYSVTVNSPTLTVKQNSQTANIDISVYDSNNAPVSNGSVNVIYPDEAKSFDVGRVSPTVQNIKDGKASFTYTAPSDLQQLVDQNISSVKFKFYYENVTTSAIMKVDFIPDANQSVIRHYTLNLLTEDGSYRAPLESTKSFSVKLEDETGVLEDNLIEELNVSIDNA